MNFGLPDFLFSEFLFGMAAGMEDGYNQDNTCFFINCIHNNIWKFFH